MRALFARKQFDKCPDPGANCRAQSYPDNRPTHRLNGWVQCTGKASNCTGCTEPRAGSRRARERAQENHATR
jgi:hypothetical protein